MDPHFNSVLNDIPLVRERLFGFLSPRDILKCRLISTSSYKHSTEYLGKVGWSIHLRNARSIQEYLRLTNNTGANSILASTRLPLSVYANFPWNTDNASPSVIDTKSICREFPVKSLECIVSAASATSPPSLQELIVSCAKRVRHIWIILADPDDNVQILIDWPDNLRLPELESFTVEYRGQVSSDGQLWEEFCQLATVSPNLKCVRGLRGGQSPIDDNSWVVGEIGMRAGALRLGELKEIEIYVTDVNFLWTSLLLRDIQHSSLTKLIIRTPDPDGFGEISDNPRPHSLFQLVKLRCPQLTSLELISTNVDPVELEAHLPNDEDADAFPPLPDVTHFGFQYQIQNAIEYPWEWNTNAGAVLEIGTLILMMKKLPGLTSVTVNWEACIALARLERNSPIVLQECKWPLVKLITINVAHSSVHDTLDFADVIMMRKKIQDFFPSLEHVVINLGADRVSWKTTTDLGLALGFAFQLEGILRVDFNNYYNAWKWTQPTFEIDSKLEKPINDNVKIVAINGISLSFANQNVDPATFTPRASVNLQVLLDVIPPGAGTGLEIQIDADLLFADDPDKPYDQLLQEVRAQRDPTVRLK